MTTTTTVVYAWPAPTAQGCEQVYGVVYADGRMDWVFESELRARS